jgi:hypothetical protein
MAAKRAVKIGKDWPAGELEIPILSLIILARTDYYRRRSHSATRGFCKICRVLTNAAALGEKEDA